MRFILPANAEGASAGAAGEDGYQAHNAATGLDLFFGAQGGFRAAPAAPVVDPKDAAGAAAGAERQAAAATGPAWQWGLRPQAVGVGERLWTLGRLGAQRAAADTLTNAYSVPWLLRGQQAGELVEWFANGSAGLRQNFTVAARPAGTVVDTGDLDPEAALLRTARMSPAQRAAFDKAGPGH